MSGEKTFVNTPNASGDKGKPEVGGWQKDGAGGIVLETSATPSTGKHDSWRKHPEYEPATADKPAAEKKDEGEK